MTTQPETFIASEPRHVYRALLNPESLRAWWGCSAVVEAKVGGSWVGGWGEGADGLGHATVVIAKITKLEPDRLVTLEVAPCEISFGIDPDSQGCKVGVHVEGGDPASQTATAQSWVAAVVSMKGWLEEHFRFVPPAVAETPTAEAAPAGADPFAAATAGAGTGAGEVKFVDEGGFGVTDPNAVIKSWSPEQGFGYVTHPQLGDVVFDYDGCDFEPVVGDKVLLLVIGKRYDGKPKIKRIACPAKGSNIR